MVKHDFYKQRFACLYPEAFFLDAGNTVDLYCYLSGKKFLENGEPIICVENIEKCSANLVLRVRTAKRSFIVKQARPWLEYNPKTEAPIDRIVEECEYYKLISGHPVLKQYHPRFLYFDETSYLLILEDIGNASDFTYLYEHEAMLQADQAKMLVQYLVALHSDFNTNTTYDRIYNRSMRKFNFDNIFILPFQHNWVMKPAAYAPGLKELAEPFINDAKLLDEIKYLGRLYESDGTNLVHGDFCPCSWFNASGVIKIIDPECCFFGPIEFDLGVFLAHLLIARQPEHVIKAIIHVYNNSIDFNWGLAVNYAGMEIMRRILNPFRFSISLTTRETKNIMDESKKMLLEKESSQLWTLMKAA